MENNFTFFFVANTRICQITSFRRPERDTVNPKAGFEVPGD